MTTTTRTERVLFLYGSQTGNSEQAAKELCEQVSTKLTPEYIQKHSKGTTKDERIIIEPVHMQLDDFLELQHAEWTRLFVIVTSSYGVGGPPLGCYRFRELCDTFVDNNKTNTVDLNGIYFAMCGLGDSKFTTFFENPTKINDALHAVGAKRVGPLGKADASGSGKGKTQLEVIEKWIDGIWPYLAEVVGKEPLPPERLEEMQAETVEVCRKINPDFLTDVVGGNDDSTTSETLLVSAIMIALLSAVYYYYYG